MAVVDLDRVPEWPRAILDHLTSNEAELRRERTADHDYMLSDTMHRMLNPSPEMPVWDSTKEFIAGVMSDHDIRAFHATRLIDFDSVRQHGLQILAFDTVIPRVKAALGPELADQVDAALASMLKVDGMFKERQGSVWLTPQRRHLHDGGCDVFFDGFGGEAVERISGRAGGELERRLKTLGSPAVVVAAIPASGWCRNTEWRLPQGMIELFLEHRGDWTPYDYGWDIMIKRNIPADRIEAVVDQKDPQVASST